MELRAGASGGAVGCAVWGDSSLGSAGEGVSEGVALSVWSAVHGVSSGGVEGARRSMIGCAACGSGAAGVVSRVGVGPAGCWGPGVLLGLANHGRVDRR